MVGKTYAALVLEALREDALLDELEAIEPLDLDDEPRPTHARPPRAPRPVLPAPVLTPARRAANAARRTPGGRVRLTPGDRDQVHRALATLADLGLAEQARAVRRLLQSWQQRQRP